MLIASFADLSREIRNKVYQKYFAYIRQPIIPHVRGITEATIFDKEQYDDLKQKNELGQKLTGKGRFLMNILVNKTVYNEAHDSLNEN